MIKENAFLKLKKEYSSAYNQWVRMSFEERRSKKGLAISKKFNSLLKKISEINFGIGSTTHVASKCANSGFITIPISEYSKLKTIEDCVATNRTLLWRLDNCVTEYSLLVGDDAVRFLAQDYKCSVVSLKSLRARTGDNYCPSESHSKKYGREFDEENKCKWWHIFTR